MSQSDDSSKYEWMTPCDRDMVGKRADKATYEYLDKRDRTWSRIEDVFFISIAIIIVASFYYGINLDLPLRALIPRYR